LSRLFIELYLDEDVSMLVAELVRARGFALQTTQEAGRKNAGDEEQLEYAVSRRQALLPHNRHDFARLAQAYFDAGRKLCGVIIVARRPPHEIVRRLLTILNQTTSDEAENQVIYI
jgi:hypothetical protein